MPAYSPYTGQVAAPLTADQNQAVAAASNNAGAYTGDFTSGATGATNAMDMTAPQITAGGINSITQGLLSPYVQSAETAADAPLEQQISTENQQNDAQNSSIGAFGGSRNAVADSLNNYYGNQAIGNTNATIANNAYSQALTTGANTASTNATNTLNTAGLNLSGAQTLGSLGTAGSNANYNDIAGLLNAGGVAQSPTQLQDTTNLSQYQDIYNSLLSNLGAQDQTLSSVTPSNTSTSGTQTGQVYSSPLGQIAGLALGVGSLASGGVFSGIGNTVSGLLNPYTFNGSQ
ncbi:MAG: hypothetical protein WB868_21550 [Xanthobacteraceae bacterium]